MRTKPGEVYVVDLGIGGKVRPMMVVSRDDSDPPRALTICVPITTAFRDSSYEVSLPRVSFLRELSYANVQGVMAVEHHLPQRRLGQFNQQTIASVKDALRFALDL
jgi:mRNA interferase MazF